MTSRAGAIQAFSAGGQGTIKVNSWSPDGKRLAYVTYPILG
jgi:hypothetical protein